MSSRSPGTGLIPEWRVTRAVLAVLWLVVVAALTLTPQPGGVRDLSVPQLSACLICGDRGTADALLNLMLLAPLGLLLNDWGWRPLRVLGAAAACSACIELTQHFIPGRFSNLGDVVWNTTGAWGSAFLWSVRARWLPGDARDAARLRNVAVSMAALVTLAFGWLMAPDWPAEPYWGQWTPDLRFMEQYKGKVIRARLDSMPLPGHRIRAGWNPRAALSRDWTIEAEVVKGPPPRALAPIVSIYNGKQQEVTMLGAVHQDLVYREGTWARRFRLDDPALWFPGVLARAATGDTVHVGVVRRGSSRCLVFNASEACPAFTPGRAWDLLLPFQAFPGGVRTRFDATWMLLLLIPVGFWSLDMRRLAAAGVVTAVGIALAIALTRLVTPPWSEVAGAAMGLLVGHGLRLVAGALLRRFPGRGSASASGLQ